jgi:hypothetical protein
MLNRKVKEKIFQKENNNIMKITKEKLEKIMVEETYNVLNEYDENDSLYFQFMDGARDEIKLLSDDDKKTLKDIGYLLKSQLGITPSALRKLHTNFFQERIMIPFKQILDNIEAQKDEEFHQGRRDQANRIYPRDEKGNIKGRAD